MIVMDEANRVHAALAEAGYPHVNVRMLPCDCDTGPCPGGQCVAVEQDVDLPDEVLWTALLIGGDEPSSTLACWPCWRDHLGFCEHDPWTSERPKRATC